MDDLYPFEDELHKFDKDDRQFKTAMAVLKNIIQSEKGRTPLKVFNDRKEMILKDVSPFLNQPQETKESPSENN